MSRSIWKGPFSDLKKIRSVKKTDTNKRDYAPRKGDNKLVHPPWMRVIHQKKIVTVWSRRSQILPAGVDKRFRVHNGRTFINVKCTQSMCSRKYGEFAVTRKRVSHKINKRKQLHRRVS